MSPDHRAPAPDPAGTSGRARKRHGCLGALAILAGALYLLNPGAGWIELLPDNLPFVGNLDEAGATALVFLGLRWLGIDPFRIRK